MLAICISHAMAKDVKFVIWGQAIQNATFATTLLDLEADSTFMLTSESFGNATSSKTWLVPSSKHNSTATTYSSHVVESETTSSFVQVIILDESLFVSADNCDNITTVCPSLDAIQARDDQLRWLNETLANSPAQWLFVAGDRPLCYTDHNGPYDYVQSTLVPLLEAHHVDAYFGLTDFVSQVLRHPFGPSHPLVEYTYASAAPIHYMDMIPTCNPVFRAPAGNATYTQHLLSESKMDVTIFNSDGIPIYHTSQDRQRKSFETHSDGAGYVPWLAVAAVGFTITVATFYGLKFKGKRFDSEYASPSICCWYWNNRRLSKHTSGVASMAQVQATSVNASEDEFSISSDEEEEVEIRDGQAI
ncbi:hypothetical protein LEN26_018987 [Aphanomyces euteiches]|nr:hypothetical protein LEN26_018987 [Aphanomyces euteiches]KAH9129790.1 hypothetical protein AeMF1_000210 [Aphanomyces euteiches]KAH9195898.1 hypothetical protein AeNC1_002123 [Aphanomyces euteiches]